jgi:rhodanese-related sulfurtransferase
VSYKSIVNAGIRVGLTISLLLFSSGMSAEEKPRAPENIEGTTIVSAEETIDLILKEPDLIVIDARKKTEYVKGHIEGAINMLNTKMKRDDLEKLAPDKSKPILFYCNGTRCMRSTDAIRKAKNWGYTNLIWFRGGWKEWSDKRLPVVTR